MQLRSGVAVAVVQAGSCSSNLTPSLGISICCRYSCKKKKIYNEVLLYSTGNDIQSPVIEHDRRDMKKEYTYMYIKLVTLQYSRN